MGSFYTLTLLGLLSAADPVPADLVIRGVTIHDGSGKPGEVGDLAIKGDRIVAVGKFQAAGKPRIIDGKGLIVAPGFIDLHTHSDNPLTHKPTNANLNYLTQGVTTVVTGNCGSGPVDVAGYFKRLEAGGVGSNVIHQVPHNSVRQQVMGNANRPPTADELKQDGSARRAGHEGRRLGPGHRPDLQPRHLRQDRRADRPGEGRGQARRLLRQPHPQRRHAAC